MSNDLALAAVTATLRDVLDVALHRPQDTAVGASTVTTLRPDRLADAPGPALNLFLYGMSPSTRGAPDDLPVRRPDGSLMAPPLVALELHFLLSAYGSEDHLDAQRMLGRAIMALAVDAVLTRDLVTAALERQQAIDGLTFLSHADLADQVEPVRVSPLALTTDELVRLWSGFGQAPYLLSVAYRASPVLLQADSGSTPALPVLDRSVDLATGPPPRLDAVRSELGAGRAATGSTVVLDGGGLANATIALGPLLLAPARTSPTRLAFALDASVPAGVHPVAVQRPDGIRSDPLALTVVPTVSAAATGATVTLTVVPPLFPGQRARTTLTSLDRESPRTLGYDRAPVTGLDPEATIEVADVPPGRWLVRIQVDGIDSVPELVDRRFGAPAVVVAAP